MKNVRVIIAASAICSGCLIDSGRAADKTQAAGPIKVFVLAGDENVLVQGLVNGRTAGVHQDFYPNATAIKDEKKRHVKLRGEAPARPLRVVTKIANGPEGGDMMGVDLMLGHRLGDALEFDAQMAVGNRKAHPEFEGNVISIDTRPMHRPLEQSPGGRDAYKGNAESYPEIGEAMGRAMEGLLNRGCRGE